MSILNNKDWFEPIEEYVEDNRIVEVLEEDCDSFDSFDIVGFDPDRFDSDTFSVWADC